MGLFSWLFGKKESTRKPVYITKSQIREKLISCSDWTFIGSPKEIFNFDRNNYICPSIDEVKEFLSRDRISETTWSDSFRCGEFAKALHLEAAKKDWAFAAVKVHHFFEGRPLHWLNMVILDTGEIKWIEPQNDEIFDYKGMFSIIRGDFS